MHVDRCVVQSKLTEIIQEYLFSISSLADHNHFRSAASETHHLRRGFNMFTHRNQHILSEEQFLEGCTRVFLINPLLKMLLDLSGIPNDWRYGDTFGDYSITNREYELGSFVEFIFTKDGKHIGCRYTRSSYSSHEMATMEEDNDYLFAQKRVPGFDRLRHIDEVWCIDWANEVSTSDRRDRKLAPGMISFSKDMTAKEFFVTLFSLGIYELIMDKVSEAFKQAENIIALEAVPQLMPNNTLAFKDAVISDLSEEKIQQYSYVFQKPQYIGLAPTLTQDDIATLNSTFFEKGYRYSLIGNADFAQSFITSEYLFRTIKDGLCIDYTAVVVGYLKSVEQLLYTIYVSAFKGVDGMCYWDTCTLNKKYFDPALAQYRYDPYDEHQSCMQEKFYHRKRTGTNALEFGALARFLRYHDECWNISEVGKEFVFACLDDFRPYCRNHHFHKDNIHHDQYSKVELIRNNTIVCLYYLLGAFKFLDTNTEVNKQLGIVDYAFENLYRAIWEKRRRLFWINTADGYEGIAYFYRVTAPHGFDACGCLVEAKLQFVKLPHMNRDNTYYDDIVRLLGDAEYVKTNTLMITHDQIPIDYVPLMPQKRR